MVGTIILALVGSLVLYFLIWAGDHFDEDDQ